MPRIDLNCDLGEGAGNEAALMPLITSASIACGAYAGDEAMMRETVRLACHHGVVIGAHPGFADREHFGRRELALSRDVIMDLVTAQVTTLQRIAAAMGASVRYVKPHGALYNLAARDVVVADAIADAVEGLDCGLALYGLSGGELLKAGRAHGLMVAGEVFADRTYQRDGMLTPRGSPDALITSEARAVEQALMMVCERRVCSTDGVMVSVEAGTLCLHGDGAGAVELVRGLRSALLGAGVELHAMI